MSARDLLIRPAISADVPAMAAIYDEVVRTAVASFDTEPRGAAYLSGKLADGVTTVRVAEEGGQLLGYAYAGTYRPRPAYDGTREVSVYVDAAVRGRGVARSLYAALLAELDTDPSVHTQVAVVALPNDASEALHRACGFAHVGTLREVGHKFGRWVDTALYQRMSRPSGEGPGDLVGAGG